MTPQVGAAPTARSIRRGYLDWLRGLAVVIMIGWHTLDSWTQPAIKATDTFWYLMLVAGFGAPTFLFLAGVSIALASGGRERRGAQVWEAAWPMVRRGGWIWVLGMLFRVQAFVVSPGSTLYGILKVDILNIMGPAISATAVLWALARDCRTRVLTLAAASLAMALATPAIRASALLTPLPDPLEWYLRPAPGRTTFTLFPWAGFVFAGAAVGVLIDRTRDMASETRLNVALAAAGPLIALVAFALSYLPPIVGASSFWTSSPAFFVLRVGVLIAVIPAAYLWGRRATASRFSPLRQFGVTSLLIYWIHVEMVYGFLSRPLHGRLTLPQAMVAFGAFTMLMLCVSLLKTRFTQTRARRTQMVSA
ncbi:MAG TPA: heparan-alpha-glucosaminide N-acetyltransferase domain-containing protein [Vicinamibacterales bacterium]